MKKTLLRSIFAAIAICFGLTANAQAFVVFQGGGLGQQYAGTTVTKQLTIESSSLPEDCSFTFTAPASCTIEPLTLTGKEINEGKTATCTFVLPELSAPPTGEQWEASIDVSATNITGVEFTPDPITFTAWLVAKTPTIKIEMPYFLAGYFETPTVGETYTLDITVSSNAYITADVTATIEGDGATFEDGNTSKILSKDDLIAAGTAGLKLIAKVTPTTAAEASKYTCTLTSTDLTEPISEFFTSKIKAAVPELTLTNGLYSENVYVGDSFTTNIRIACNKYVNSDITITALSDSIVSISKTTITAEEIAASTNKTFDISVTVTPTLVVSGYQRFYLKVSTTGVADSYVYARCEDVKEKSPNITANVTQDWEDKTQHQEFNTTFTLTGNPFLTDAVTLTSENTDIRSINPSVIALDDIKDKTVTITVTIVPSTASEVDSQGYTSSTIPYEIKATSTGVDKDITLEFYVFPSSQGGTTALENATVAGQATKIMENGQIFIIRDGVRYNILGTVVK